MRRRSSFFYEEDPADKELINLTPLIDVIFIVLISFILIAPLLETDSINLAKSTLQTTQKMTTEPSSLKIEVREDNSIWIGNQKQSFATLQTFLSKQKNKDELYVYHDRKAYFATYQEIKNLAEKTGFTTLKVVLKSS